MNRYETVRYEMFLRVRNYGAAQRDRFPEASPAGQAFATVSQAVADIEAQTTARLTAAADARKAKSRTQMELRAKMKAIARTARGLALTDEAWVKRLRMPTRTTDKALLDTARFFLQETEPHRERLTIMGLPSSVLDDARVLVEALEMTKDQRRTGAQRRSAAGRGMRAAFEEVFAIRTLDVIVVNTVSEDPAQLAAWETARHITVPPRSSGPTPKPTPQPSPAPTPAPVPSSQPAPAPAAGLVTGGDTMPKAS